MRMTRSMDVAYPWDMMNLPPCAKMSRLVPELKMLFKASALCNRLTEKRTSSRGIPGQHLRMRRHRFGRNETFGMIRTSLAATGPVSKDGVIHGKIQYRCPNNRFRSFWKCRSSGWRWNLGIFCGPSKEKFLIIEVHALTGR